MLTNQIRKTEVIRAAQATTAALQGVSGMALFGDLVPPKVAGAVILIAAFGQFWLAAWNSGLHNEPDPNPEFTPKP